MCPGSKPYFARVLNLNIEYQTDKNKLNNFHEKRKKKRHQGLARTLIAIDHNFACIRNSPEIAKTDPRREFRDAVKF
jgi:hypothetical protein